MILTNEQQVATQETMRWIKTAADTWGQEIRIDAIKFDLKGTCAGQAIRQRAGAGNLYLIRYNTEILVHNFDGFIARTVPHEVAHIVQYQAFPRCKGHGKAWKRIMRTFGLEPERCHEYDLSNVKVRRVQRIQYECQPGCSHEITKIKHNRMLRCGVVYRCRMTGKPIYQAEAAQCA